jgi:hypothetical protein
MLKVDGYHMPIKLNAEVITAAIQGFELQKRQIDIRIAELRSMLSGGTATKTELTRMPKRRKMSAAARKAIGDAQRKRWAGQKAAGKK